MYYAKPDPASPPAYPAYSPSGEQPVLQPDVHQHQLEFVEAPIPPEDRRERRGESLWVSRLQRYQESSPPPSHIVADVFQLEDLERETCIGELVAIPPGQLRRTIG